VNAVPVPETEFHLSAEARRLIDRETAKFPPDQRQSAVLAALAIAQREVGWLPPAILEQVATHLGMAPVAVYEVASFYHMFQLEPVGRHKICVCTNLPCQLSGANRAARHLQARLGIAPGETTADGGFTLVEGECMGACGDAPVLLVDNEHLHGFMSDEKIDALIAALSAREGR